MTCDAYPERAVVNFNGVINPYGERNLEMEPELKVVPEVYCDLDQQAKRAFAKGVRPPAPDMPELIKQAKAKKQAQSRPAQETFHRLTPLP
jgi:hypothetical protein